MKLRRTLADAVARNIRAADTDSSTSVPFIDLWNSIAHQKMEWISDPGRRPGGVR